MVGSWVTSVSMFNHQYSVRKSSEIHTEPVCNTEVQEKMSSRSHHMSKYRLIIYQYILSGNRKFIASIIHFGKQNVKQINRNQEGVS